MGQVSKPMLWLPPGSGMHILSGYQNPHPGP